MVIKIKSKVLSVQFMCLWCIHEYIAYVITNLIHSSNKINFVWPITRNNE